ncbi:MAG: hypothetical protein KC561_20550, partial [Myxococcales bacterium]|nr:hypothetical protein [Myxococcales bacterium]
MKFYQPIDGLLGSQRRRRKGRVTFGIFGIGVLGVAIYCLILFYSDPVAEARTDQLNSLPAPDFTTVLTDQAREEHDSARAAVDDQQSARSVVALGRPQRLTGSLRRNQTLFIAMRQAGIEPDNIQPVVEAVDDLFDFRHAQPGHEWEAELDEDGRITDFRYGVSPEEVYAATRQADGTYTSHRVEVALQTQVEGFAGTVITNVYDAVQSVGEGSAVASRFMSIFRW